MSEPDSSNSRSARAVSWLVAAAFFMENLDATAITTSLPAMAQTFGTAPAQLSIGLSAYLVALAAFIPASGWVADRYGARRVFAAAIAVFTVASVLCALSSSLPAFTAARILQGIGGALMVPVGRLVVLRSTARQDLVRAIATITWPGLAAPVIGPALGGFITATWSWHWIFLLNVPLGIGLLAAAWFLVPDAEAAPRPFDLPGFVGSALACSLLMMSVEMAGHAAGLGALAMFAAGVALLWWVVRHFRRTAAPLLDLRPLRIPTFAVTVWGGSLSRIAIGSTPFLIPLMLQLAFGLPGTTAGLLMLALFAGNLAMKPGTGWVMRRFGLRNVLLVNGALLAASFGACALLTGQTPPAAMAAVLFCCGLFRSMQFTALNTIAFANVPPPQMSGASTLFSALAQMNAGMGIAAGALLLKLAETIGYPPNDTAGFRFALCAMGLVALAGLADSLRLQADAGAQVVGPGQ